VTNSGRPEGQRGDDMAELGGEVVYKEMDKEGIRDFFAELAREGDYILLECSLHECKRVDIYEICTKCEYFRKMHYVKGAEMKSPHRRIIVECHLPRMAQGLTLKLGRR